MGLIAIGAGLAIASWVVTFLMVLRLLEPSFALCFGSYAALLTGMMTGLVGAMSHSRGRRHEEDAWGQ